MLIVCAYIAVLLAYIAAPLLYREDVTFMRALLHWEGRPEACLWIFLLLFGMMTSVSQK